MDRKKPEKKIFPLDQVQVYRHLSKGFSRVICDDELFRFSKFLKNKLVFRCVECKQKCQCRAYLLETHLELYDQHNHVSNESASKFMAANSKCKPANRFDSISTAKLFSVSKQRLGWINAQIRNKSEQLVSESLETSLSFELDCSQKDDSLSNSSKKVEQISIECNELSLPSPTLLTHLMDQDSCSIAFVYPELN